MKHLFPLVLAALFIALTAPAQTPATSPDDEAVVREWIKTLASDAFGGRKPR